MHTGGQGPSSSGSFSSLQWLPETLEKYINNNNNDNEDSISGNFLTIHVHLSVLSSIQYYVL